MDAEPERVPAGARVALAVLLGLIVLSPWPFGSVHLRTTQAIALVSLVTALGAFAWDGWHNRLCLPPRSLLAALLGFWALAVFQLIPLPPALHHWLAPGSAWVWYPSEPAAAAVLGAGPHPISINPEATQRWLAFATGVVGLALAAAPALRSRTLLMRASLVIVASGLAVAVYGLVARVLFGDRLFGVFAVPTVSPFGPFVSKNHFAGYVEMAALLAAGLAAGLADEARRGSGWLTWIDSPKAPRVVAALGAAAILVLAVPVSLSRGGTLSLAAGLLGFSLVRYGQRRSRGVSPRRAAAAAAVLGLALLAFAVALPSTARARLLSLSGVTSEDSGAYRLSVWRDTREAVLESPLVGFGMGAYEEALPRFKTSSGDLRVEHAENDYLETLTEGGAVGGLLLATLVALTLGMGLRVAEDKTHRIPRALRAAGLAALAAVLVHSLFDFNLHVPSNALLLVGLMTIMLAPECRKPSEHGTTRLRVVHLAGPLAALVSLAIALHAAWQNEPAPRLHRITGLEAAALRRSTLDIDLVAALRRRPASAPHWVLVAWLRWPESETEAAALGRWGTALDPQDARLSRAAALLQRQ